MARILIFGGTGRLGSAVAERLRADDHAVFALGRTVDDLPGDINHAIFCQRYRGPDNPCGEFSASVLFTADMMSRIHFAQNPSVIIVSSIVGTRPDLVHTVPYQCAKAAVIHLAGYLEMKHRVPVAVVTPGAFTGKTIENSMESVVDRIVDAL